MPNTDFYFSRFHVTIPDGSEKISTIRLGMNTRATTKSGEFRYKFLEVEFADYLGDQIIIGSLIKYDPNGQDEVVNEKEEQVEQSENVNRVIARSRFIFHLATNVVAFHEVGTILSKNQFVERFRELFSENTGILKDSIALSPVDEQTAFIEEVQKLTTVRKIVINIVPSNPHFSKEWQKVDQDLKARGIDKYTEVQESKKAGDGIQMDDETQRKLSMAEDGYGTGVVVGEIDGRKVTVTTSDSGKQVSERIFVEPKEANQSLIGKLIAKILEIGARANL